MKNNFKFLLLALLVMILHSCDSEDYSFDYTDIEANVVLSDSKISVFDTNEDLNLSLITANGITIDKLEIFKDNSKISDALINGTSATFNTSSLGDFLFGDDLDEPTGSFSLSSLATISNGKTTNSNFSVKVSKAITLDEEVATVKYGDTTSQQVIFETFTKYAAIDEVILQWKNKKAGVYAEDTDYTFDIEEDYIDLNDLDYKTKYNLIVGDTLYYKFIAKSGVLIDEIETSIVFVAQEMGSSSSASLSNSNSEFNLSTLEYAEGEIQFIASNGFEAVSGISIDFVKIAVPVEMTPEEYFTAGDLINARTAYDSGTKITSATNLVIDDIFVYKVERLDEDDNTVISYGLIQIGDVTLVNGTEETVNFSFKEGQIIE